MSFDYFVSESIVTSAENALHSLSLQRVLLRLLICWSRYILYTFIFVCFRASSDGRSFDLLVWFEIQELAQNGE